MTARHLLSLELDLSEPIPTADLVAVALAAEDAGFTTLGIGGPGSIPDPTTILAAIAARTSQIGLAAAVDVGTALPYDFTRRLASLDHLSKGRAGWRPYAGPGEFGAESVAEFVDVVSRLLDSWDDDAHLYDKANGLYVDIDRVHRVDYVGRFFKVAGPLDIPRAPQGRPVLIRDVTPSDHGETSWPVADVVQTESLRAARDLGRPAGGPLITVVGRVDELVPLRAAVDDELIDGVTVRSAPLASAIERAAKDLRLRRLPPEPTLRDVLGLPRPKSLFVRTSDGASA